MPSQRKRIGYLPDKKVHEIIEKICLENNISQSKVTGILVEEALRSRGAFKSHNINFSLSENTKIDEFYKNNSQSFQSSKDEVLLNHLRFTYQRYLISNLEKKHKDWSKYFNS